MTQTPLPVVLERRASYGYSGRGALTAITFAADIDIGPTGPCGFGRAVGWTGLFVCFGGGVSFSSTNSGFSSGITSGGGGGGGSSSGGGVGCGGSGSCSIDISTVASG